MIDHGTVERFTDVAVEEMRFHISAGLSRYSEHCGSPIETIVLAALSFGCAMDIWNSLGLSRFKLTVTKRLDEFPIDIGSIVVLPQYPWNSFRIDFAVGWESRTPLFFIECDGHQFHERTPEQAEKDRSRDRVIQQAGIPIIRFTGREIYRDPFKCAAEIIDFLGTRIGVGRE